MNKYVVQFAEVGREDGGLVGGKGANLGEMTKIGIPVPQGFIVTAGAYFYFLEKSGLKNFIKSELSRVDAKNEPVLLQHVAEKIKRTIVKAPIPEEISSLIIKNYEDLKKHKGLRGAFESTPAVAVRSSATAEDLPQASFAGQQATFLNVRGEANVVNAVRECWASLFEARAIFYREENRFDHFKVGIAVPVQRMVQSDVSGVMFTVDPVNNDKKRIVVEAVWGLGEMIVQGTATPDHYEIFKDEMKILEARQTDQLKMLVREQGTGIREVKVADVKVHKRKMTDEEVLETARIGLVLEKHYYHPQDIEFAVEKGKVYIVQTRPITTLAKSGEQLAVNSQVFEKVLDRMTVILEGEAASPGLKSGPAVILKSAKEIGKIKLGDILVAPQTNPDFVPAMKKASAIITDSGGRTSHAAIVSRELGIPAVVGTSEATKILKNGMVVTVDGASGKVYRGGLPAQKDKMEIKSVVPKASPKEAVKTVTKVYVNLAEPEKAKQIAGLNCDGVGLLRAEFMLAGIGIHPKKIIEDKKQKEYIEKLADQITTFAQSFYPRPVVYRATDFKTNEYRSLKGGDKFEPLEPNPMIGFRGAYRYIVEPEVFKMEMEAIKIVRNDRQLRNLWLMLPFVRTVKELIEVKHLVYAAGLPRSPSFKLWMMCEIPANVILLDKFIEAGIDGVSVGSNDLTMLMLGVDRDNEHVAPEYDERNAALLWAFEKIVKTCKKYDVTCSMCGQAPSDFPDLTEKLVEYGITSVSVNPDVVGKTREIIYEAEKKLVAK
ncbi:phosphoenolpyruvate synthase [Candidatus Gottesmanbacteria bacterium RIFCSPHIGHO2_01_FULL_42_12]|uniref:Phosphoenolpyruvate synthase n=1 Tax=Candidatus Gottesmanbacteria bacterium RIFCSPHIGHO2_01_FULL_42_12 TaxID=1798377 RepID=A0A1F5Z4Q1_9BACT|nr:MAG: phosphoenolpyruvate synthase [Candidatus Gottesmanbacteria bacterium RIFCSPHIGHO2_01_FULL_42_12]